jgi:capsular exopolysaccharide synthesis family protein
MGLNKQSLLPVEREKLLLQQLSTNNLSEFNGIPEKGLDLRLFFGAMRRRILPIVGITALVTGAAYLRNHLTPANYEGKFQLQVEPVMTQELVSDPSALIRTSEGVPAGSNPLTVDYPTLLKILQGSGMKADIVRNMQTQFLDFSAGDLLRGMTIVRLGDRQETTSIFEVTYQGTDPNEVQAVLDTTADRYLQFSLEERKSSISEGVRFLEAQLPSLQQRADSLRSQIEVLQKEYELSDPNTELQLASERSREMTEEQLATTRELQELQVRVADLQSRLGQDPSTALAASTLSDDPGHQQLLQELQDVENQLAVASARFTDRSPFVQDLEKKQQKLSALASQNAEEVLGQDRANLPSDLSVLQHQDSIRQGLSQQLIDNTNQIQALSVRSQALAAAKADLDRQVQELPEIARRYDSLQKRLEIVNQSLSQLLTQRENLKVEAAQTEFPWQLLSEPQLPRDANGKPIPIANNLPRDLGVGAILGLFLGSIAAFLWERRRDTFFTVEDVRLELPLGFLGVIPFCESIRQMPDCLPALNARSAAQEGDYGALRFLEAFSALYGNLLLHCSGRSIRSLVVTSATAGDGKSTVAINLARTVSLRGQRVLLVDANLRSPQLHTRMNLSNQEGLTDLLARELRSEELIRRLPLEEHVYVLPAGKTALNSVDLLTSDEMRKLMIELKSTFDLIIFDTPNLKNFPDARFLSPLSDGLLMVVGVDKTSRSATLQLLEELQELNQSFVGIVANNTEPSLSHLPIGARRKLKASNSLKLEAGK